MEPTFDQARVLSKVFRVITLGTVIAVAVSAAANAINVFAMTRGGAPKQAFTFLMHSGTEVIRLGAAFWIFTQIAKGQFLNEHIVKGCRVLAFVEFLRCVFFLQNIMTLPSGVWTTWQVYFQFFQGITVSLVNGSLIYCLGTSIHWAITREEEREQQAALDNLNPPPEI
jgi:hypothetical protein